MAAPCVKCPRCGNLCEFGSANPYRPFCSERCRLLDLGAWLAGERAIPGEPIEDGEGTAAPADRPETERGES